MIIEKRGNIFTTKAQTIVNTINCVGVMGAGIAYEFRLRDKDMFDKYQKLCMKKEMSIGKLWIYNSKDTNTNYQKILNFPTKQDWKFPSKEAYLHKGLEKFVQSYKQKGITSIAFPLLGADRGGLDPQKSLQIMQSYLGNLEIDVEIWHFDSSAEDDLYEKFKALFLDLDEKQIKEDSGIRIDKIRLITKTVEDININSLSGLLRVKGIGETTLEKLFDYIKNYKEEVHLFSSVEDA